ncbi:MAG: MOSC N-terminal beta barrel domain-containing protein [Actinomycetota bacterium]
MQVSEIWRYPVKSMQGERLTSAPVGRNGIEGDRGWALFDVDSGVHLTARRQPELLFASARLDGTGADAGVRITLPDGTETGSDHTLSAWLGRPVRLERASGEVQGRFQTQADETETGEWFTWDGPDGSFHDSGKAQVSLVSEATFRSWERRRFRINLVLDEPGEIDLVGRQIRIGDAELQVIKGIDRCVMVTRPQPAFADDAGEGQAFERDLAVLKTVNAELDGKLGVGANTTTPGTLTVGDVVSSIS